MPGDVQVVHRRLDALQEAIRHRGSWVEIEFLYDQVRSSVTRALGTRNRETDRKDTAS